MRAAPASSRSRRSRLSRNARSRCWRDKVSRDARQDFFGLDRLGDVVHGAELEARHLVGHFAARRQEDDGGVAGFGLRLEPAADLEPVDPRHHDVEQHQVGRGALRDLERGRAVAGRPGCGGRCHAACGPAPEGWWRCRPPPGWSTAARPRARAASANIALPCARSDSEAASVANAVEVEVGGEPRQALAQRRLRPPAPPLSSSAIASRSLTAPIATASRSFAASVGVARRIAEPHVARTSGPSLPLTKLHAEMRLQRGEHRLRAHRLRARRPRSRRRLAAWRVSPRALAVTAMTGMRAVRSSAASRRVAENPSRSAIFTSMKITSGRWRVASAIAFEAARGGDHLQTGTFEQAGQDPAAHGAVVDHERGHVLTGREPRVERGLTDVLPRRAPSSSAGHQRQREDRTGCPRRACSPPSARRPSAAAGAG